MGRRASSTSSAKGAFRIATSDLTSRWTDGRGARFPSQGNVGVRTHDISPLLRHFLTDHPLANEFPQIWFDSFLNPDNAAPVDRELAFIQRHLPMSVFPRLLDVPCGIGRHAGPLAALGYHVVGIDRSESALAMARERYPDVEFLEMDMFEIARIGRTFDGLLCLWQSFGYGTSSENRQLLEDMGNVIRPGGRILMDIYNRDAAVDLPASATEQRGGRAIQTRRTWQERRLRVELEYSDAEVLDTHAWEIFSPSEIRQTAAEANLHVLLCCAWFDSSVRPSKEHLRMQLLLERRP